MSEFHQFQLDVAANIKARRLALGLTQEDMESGEFGVNVRTFQRIETGVTDITLSKLFLIAQRLQTTPSNLLEIKQATGKFKAAKPKK